MYFTRRFYLIATAVVLVMASGYWLPPLFAVGRVLLVALVVAVVADFYLLYKGGKVKAYRSCADRFSNGDDNLVELHIESSYKRKLWIEVIDEVPVRLQRRDVCFHTVAAPMEETVVSYQLRPVERGEYSFGHIRVFVASAAGLLQLRYTCGEPKDVKVYPSYLMLRRYELLAMSNNLRELGLKRVRTIGHNTDFEQIKDYVPGDDFRSINWRATARRSTAGVCGKAGGVAVPRLMVNVYQEERSQPVYCVVDKGRTMQHAFRGMTLLDYAVNASLVLSYVAVRKDDMAGLVTFSDNFGTFVAASRRPGQMQQLQEALYAEQTQFAESDFSALTLGIDRRLSRRALLILFTSFNGLSSLNRQLSYFRQLAKRHRLLVVFFEDDQLSQFVASFAERVGREPLADEDYYQHVITQKFAYEQRLIVQTLRKYGIQSLLTTPQRLSVDVINRYLEIKKQI